MSPTTKPKPNLAALTRRNTGVVTAMAMGTDPTPTGDIPSPTASAFMSILDLKAGQSYSIPVHLIRRSEIGARIYYKADEVDEMIVSLRVQKQITPATGYVSGDRVVIIDGGKRHTACTQGGIDELIVYILPPPADRSAEYVRSYVANHVRSEQTKFDDAQRFQALLESGYIASQDELAAMLQIHKSTVSKILRLAKIPDNYRRYMVDHSEHFPLSVAYALAPIFDERGPDMASLSDTQIQDILDDVCRRALGVQAVETLVRDLAKPKTTRVRSQQVSLQYGEQKGVLKINREKGDFVIHFKGVTPAQLEAIESRFPEWLKQTNPGS